MWLFDTNIFTALLDLADDGHDRVIARGDAAGWDHMGIPITVAAEALAGRLKYLERALQQSPRHFRTAYSRLAATHRSLSLLPMAEFDELAERCYADRSLFSGTMSRNDRIIAAITIAGGHVLETRNVAHFAGVRGLEIENWIDDPIP